MFTLEKYGIYKFWVFFSYLNMENVDFGFFFISKFAPNFSEPMVLSSTKVSTDFIIIVIGEFDVSL